MTIESVRPETLVREVMARMLIAGFNARRLQLGTDNPRGQHPGSSR